MSRSRPREEVGGSGWGCLGPHPGERLMDLAGGVQAQGCVSQHALRQTPPQQMATAADGSHPTEMNSC